MMNALSFDLEDWFCVSNMAHVIPPDQWDTQDLRIEKNTARLLALLDKHDAQATFFVLGWIAERRPALIRTIAQKGHEIATHGYSHRLLTEMTPEQFSEDLDQALAVTQPLAREKIIGFRAPTFTVTTETLWSLEILKAHGILYDSSVFPISFLQAYSRIPGLSTDIFQIAQGIVEFPIACAHVFGLRVPFGGGCFFRAFPYPLIAHFMRKCARQSRSVMFYLHPWEIDPAQPRIHMPILDRFRHYVNLHETFDRLDRLLTDFPFTSTRKVLDL
jgi:polysaccharide deacetylase family protein (PEP-CTERM system associated)